MRVATVSSGLIDLFARIAGEPAAPCLVLLHGWPHSSKLYEGVMEEFSEDFFTLAFDLPEVGESRGSPSSAEKTVIAEIILDAAEELGGHSIIIAGLDVGGMIAFAAARNHDSRIAGAVVMNTVLPGIEPWSEVLADPRIWHFAFHNIPQLPETLVDGHQREYFDFFVDVLAGNPKAITDTMRDAFAEAYRRPEALKAGFDWYRAMEADAKTNKRHKRITTPLLYLRGDADPSKIDDYVNSLKESGAENLSSGTLPHSGEFAPLEAPEEFVAALKKFGRKCAASEMTGMPQIPLSDVEAPKPFLS
jgi:pimeloyl-ACP methyl ester carboxylesterase